MLRLMLSNPRLVRMACIFRTKNVSYISFFDTDDHIAFSAHALPDIVLQPTTDNSNFGMSAAKGNFSDRYSYRLIFLI